ncbi:hypothetical protein BSA16_28275 [Micromonospora sp. Rc5]|nr:hypothetical protein BSA16_28275 [Micromonospora sp. Rc5]
MARLPVGAASLGRLSYLEPRTHRPSACRTQPQRGAALGFPARRPSAGTGVLGCHYGWYNTRRIQKDLGWRSPDEYEAAWHTHQARQGEMAIV